MSRPWRKFLSVHPTADLLPLMDAKALRWLADDIKANGLQEPVTLDVDNPAVLLDGRNRLDALELLGVEIVDDDGRLKNWVDGCAYPLSIGLNTAKAKDVLAFMVSKNIARRHLTAQQKRVLIVDILKLTPSKSDNSIAKAVGGSHHTVAAARAEQPNWQTANKDRTEDSERKARGRKPAPAKPKPSSSPSATPSPTTSPTIAGVTNEALVSSLRQYATAEVVRIIRHLFRHRVPTNAAGRTNRRIVSNRGKIRVYSVYSGGDAMLKPLPKPAAIGTAGTADVSAAPTKERDRYARLWPTEILWVASTLSPEWVMSAWLRFTGHYVKRLGDVPDDDVVLARFAGVSPKRWGPIRAELVAAGLGAARGGRWVDESQDKSFAMQEKGSERARTANAARWAKNRA